MKFIAQSPDLDLELTSLDGSAHELKSKIFMNSKKVLEIITKWQKLESAKDENISPIQVIADELSDVYDKSADWFLENFDFSTLQEIITHVARTMASFKKKSTTSS